MRSCEIHTQVWVNMLLAIIIIVLLLMALLLLLAIQVMNLYGGDPKSCAETDLLGGPEMNSIRSRTEHELPDDLSAGGCSEEPWQHDCFGGATRRR
jgi:hypothetical protein